MQIKDLQQGNSLFILVKGDAPDYKLEHKVGVFKGIQPEGQPAQQNSALNNLPPQYLPYVQQAQAMAQSYTMYVEVDGEIINLKGITLTAEFIDDPKIYIGLDKAALKRKVEDIHATSKSHINLVNKHESYVKGCENILQSLDENYQKTKQNNEEITELKGMVAALLAQNQELMSKVGEKKEKSVEAEDKEIKTTNKK